MSQRGLPKLIRNCSETIRYHVNGTGCSAWKLFGACTSSAVGSQTTAFLHPQRRLSAHGRSDAVGSLHLWVALGAPGWGACTFERGAACRRSPSTNSQRPRARSIPTHWILLWRFGSL